MINILLNVLCGAGTLMTLFGSYIFIKVLLLPNSPPADRTNRINHLRVLFFAIQRPEKFIKMYPWLAYDEMENITKE